MFERDAESRAPQLEEIKSDLQRRSAEIPFAAWHRFFPGLQIPIGSHEADGRGRPLEVRHTVGHDAVETFLARNGRILEKLVHYSSDGPDCETCLPDEVLGETSEDRYHWVYPIAVYKLEILKQRAEKMLDVLT